MENKEPGSDSTAEQEARSVKYEQDAEQFPELHRQDKVLTPNLFLAIVSVYLLFVTAVVAFGAIAFYSGHKTLLEVDVFSSIALLLVVPISVAWYLSTFRKKSTEKSAVATVVTGKKSRLEKAIESPVGSLLLRISNHPLFRVFQYAWAVFSIEENIRKWARGPRLSLAMIVFSMAFMIFLAISDVARWFERLVIKESLDQWKFNQKTTTILGRLHDQIVALDEHRQLTTTMVDDLTKARKTLDEPKPSQVDVPPEEPTTQLAVENKEEPSNGS